MGKLTRKEQEDWKKFSKAEDDHHDAKARFRERRDERTEEYELQKHLIKWLQHRGLLPSQRHKPPHYAKDSGTPKQGAAINIIIEKEKT
tara:strand:+ start:135 stop:401 length:267 start_codon:yes stop_codon:yes gene_type:complete